jgi:6-phosphogluconolactonase
MNEPVWASPADDRAVASRIEAAIGSGGAAIAVPGGRTPIPILEALAARTIPWERVTFTPTDDRDVPHDHPASNFGALRRALGETGARLLPLEAGAEPPRFELVWVGMGTDGHVASIFPNLYLATDDSPAVVRTLPDPLPPEAPFARVTLNYAALVNAGEILLVVRGMEKRKIIEDAVAGANDLPIARLLAAAKAPVTIFWSP